MKNLNALDWVALVLVVIGGINWGLLGILNIDVMNSTPGVMTTFTRTIYAIVGIAALYSVFTLSTKTQ